MTQNTEPEAPITALDKLIAKAQQVLQRSADSLQNSENRLLRMKQAREEDVRECEEEVQYEAEEVKKNQLLLDILKAHKRQEEAAKGGAA